MQKYIFFAGTRNSDSSDGDLDDDEQLSISSRTNMGRKSNEMKILYTQELFVERQHAVCE